MKKKFLNYKYSSPILSIAIPTYNRPELLYFSLNSAIKQSYKGVYEILVIDNSTDLKIKNKVDDLIESVSKKKQIRLIRNKNNLGMFGNWNQCLKSANGQYISILNDDDLLNYEFVENVINDIDGSKMIIYDHEIISDNNFKKNIGGRIRKILKKIDFKKEKKLFKSDLIFRNPSNGSLGVVVKRNNAILVGGYENKYYPCADYSFNYKYITKYGGLKIKKNLCKYRILVNESLNKNCLIDFVKKDYDLRKRIYLKSFRSRKYLIYFLDKLNFLQACSQCTRYIFLRNLTLKDFKDLNFGKLDKFKYISIRLISLSSFFCIFIEIIISLLWKIIFFLY